MFGISRHSIFVTAALVLFTNCQTPCLHSHFPLRARNVLAGCGLESFVNSQTSCLHSIFPLRARTVLAGCGLDLFVNSQTPFVHALSLQAVDLLPPVGLQALPLELKDSVMSILEVPLNAPCSELLNCLMIQHLCQHLQYAILWELPLSRVKYYDQARRN